MTLDTNIRVMMLHPDTYSSSVVHKMSYEKDIVIVCRLIEPGNIYFTEYENPDDFVEWAGEFVESIHHLKEVRMA